jgi:hypothetical protein
MIRTTLLIAGLGVFTALFAFAGSAEAGTCQPVAAKGYGKDAAMATTRAQAKLVQKAARKGGRLMNTSTSCKPSPLGFECKMSGAACP